MYVDIKLICTCSVYQANTVKSKVESVAIPKSPTLYSKPRILSRPKRTLQEFGKSCPIGCRSNPYRRPITSDESFAHRCPKCRKLSVWSAKAGDTVARAATRENVIATFLLDEASFVSWRDMEGKSISVRRSESTYPDVCTRSAWNKRKQEEVFARKDRGAIKRDASEPWLEPGKVRDSILDFWTRRTGPCARIN